VIGAGGYIGFGVSCAFRRAGFMVYGLIRNEEKKKLMLEHEIIPVISDAANVEEYRNYIETCPIIIDCIATFRDNDPADIPKTLISIANETSSKRDRIQPPKIFIYTSGIMVYGEDERLRDETWPISDTKNYSKWRKTVEDHLLNSKDLDGIVIRPGWVFGVNAASQLNWENEIFKTDLKGKNKDRKFSWIHINDLAEAYVLAAQKRSVSKKQVFNIVNGYDNINHFDLVKKAASIAGLGEVKWKDTKEDLLYDNTSVLSPLKAMTLLDWKPKILGFYENLEFYYESFRALKSKYV